MSLRWLAVAGALLVFILIPFAIWEERFAELSASAARSGGPAAFAALSGLLALDVVLPVPSSIVSTAAGSLFGLWKGAAASWTGMSAGCLLGYGLGLRAARRPAQRLLGSAEYDRAARATARYGAWTIVLFRAVPVLAEATVLFAGMTAMPMHAFLPAALLSNLGVSLAYAAVGAYAARVDSFLLAFAGATLVPGLSMLAARLIGSGRRSRRAGR